jgi:hypothetical protein
MASDEKRIGGGTREEWEQHLVNNDPLDRRTLSALLAAAFSPSGFQAGAEQKWQPIETAPKDGTNVLLAGRGWMTVGCYWPGRSCWTVDSVTGPQITQPIFGWTPLPSPPPEPLS